MVGINKKKIILCMSVIYAIVYFLLLHVLCKGFSYSTLINVQFLNFSELGKFGINTFAIEFLIPFTLLFFVIYNGQIEYLTIHTSFMTMLLHKKNKNWYYQSILIENAKNMGLIFLILVGMLSFCMGCDGFIFHYQIELSSIGISLLYFLRYCLFIYYMITCIRIHVINHTPHYISMIPYGIFATFLLLDSILGTHLFTISNTFSQELIYIILESIIGNLFCYYFIYRFKKGDIEND